MKNYINLLEASFAGIAKTIARCEQWGFYWETSKLFIKEENGQAIAHVAAYEVDVVIDAKWHKACALHAICTADSHKGQGLATRLIQEALAWADERSQLSLLFTEIPAFYEKLSFAQLPEHRFILPCSHIGGTEHLRPMVAPDDQNLFVRCFKDRAALSNQIWLSDRGDIASFNAIFATYPSYWSLYYSQSIDGLICCKLEGETLHVFDVVAKVIPTLEQLLAHFSQKITKIYFYFPPDRFSNEAQAEPHLYDHGHLMIHGSWPSSRPFMISPLSRC